MELAAKLSLKVLLNFGLTPLGLTWIAATLILSLGHLYNALLNWQKDGLRTASPFMKEFYLYGVKYADAKRKSSKRRNAQTHSPSYSVQVPKNWFYHFYIVSSIVNTSLLVVTYRAYFLRIPCPKPLLNIINLLTFYVYGQHKPYFVNTDQTSTILILFLLTIQGIRRLYECRRVSVYSHSTIHISHYILGHFFYACQGITVLLGAPQIANLRLKPGQIVFKQRHLWGVVFFVIASAVQFQSHWLLARLRKTDKIKKDDHGIADGGMFRYVSSPHLLAECLIYASIWYIGGKHHGSAAVVFTFVVVNQTLAALLTHQWYRTRFPAYPKRRKAIIPFIL